MIAWLGGPVIGIANGVVREAVYKDRVGDLAAHQMSTGSAVALFASYVSALERRWPIPTTRTALAIGGTWTGLTILFELGFGHYVAGSSWRELLEDYDVRKGRLWLLVLISIATGPAAARKVHTRRRPESL